MTTFVPSNTWPKTSLARHFQVFAVRVRELVHPEAQDIYRVHALSTPQKLKELASCCFEVFEGRYPRKALDPIVEEVIEALHTDPVVAKILRDRKLTSQSILFSIEKTTEELQSLVKLWLGIVEEHYKLTTEDLILETLARPNERKLLLSLAKIHTAELVSSGFHRRHVLNSIEWIFFDNKIGRCTPQLMQRYFDFFPEAERKYSVLILGDKGHIERAAETFKFPIISSDEEVRSVAGFPIAPGVNWEDGERALHWDTADGRDPYQAAQSIQLLFSLPNFFNVVYPSKSQIRIGKRCLLKDKKAETVYEVVPEELFAPVHSYTSQIVYSSSMISQFIDYNINLVKKDGDSYGQIFSSLSTASSALESRNPQAQLVLMWSAFEALLPQPFRDEKSARITHFSRLIMPAVVRKYVKGKFRIYLDDVVRHSAGDLTAIIGLDVDVKDRPKRFFEILRDDGEQCTRLFDAVSDSPIALARINHLYELARAPKAVLDKIESHEKRVSWQIYRIYRERNAIVHSGRSSDTVPLLVENSFLYYRLVMRGIQFVSKNYQVHHPHGALQLLGGQYASFKSAFKDIQNVSDKDERRHKATELIFAET